MPIYDIPAPLDQIFKCVPKKGWIALVPKSGLSLSMFKTERLGKLMPNGQLQFTVGATQAGELCNLNETIRAIIKAEGLKDLAGKSTRGSQSREVLYPTIQITGVAQDVIARIVYRVEGAVFQVVKDGAA